MRRGSAESEELWKTNIRRLEKLDEQTREKLKTRAQSMANNTSLSKDVALMMELDHYTYARRKTYEVRNI